jgi:2-keto-4-pentenoate hydratase/2-oxohepta-3-ene-1,7-dioic acid hydratase in catechol pathway
VPAEGPATLVAALAEGALDPLARALAGETPRVAADEVVWLPPVPCPPRIFCVAKNYGAHAAELGGEAPPAPVFFTRHPASLVGHRGTVLRPRASRCLDFEGELAVVIGRHGRHLLPKEALGVVGGYTCFNDGSVRDWQRESLTAGKNFDASGAAGPWLVPAADVPDPQAVAIETRLDGETVQSGSTADMVHPVALLIAYLSTVTELLPGDVIATGTPAGVGWGREPPLWLEPGHRLEVAIESVGTLEVTVGEEP